MTWVNYREKNIQERIILVIHVKKIKITSKFILIIAKIISICLQSKHIFKNNQSCKYRSANKMRKYWTKCINKHYWMCKLAWFLKRIRNIFFWEKFIENSWQKSSTITWKKSLPFELQCSFANCLHSISRSIIRDYCSCSECIIVFYKLNKNYIKAMCVHLARQKKFHVIT